MTRRPGGLALRACVVLALLASGGFAPTAGASAAADAPVPAPQVMYLARRSWHIDVGFAVSDLGPSLSSVARRFPAAKYVFFGFGDRHYLLSRRKGPWTLAGALFPGAGMVLATTIENSPSQAFGESHVLVFALSSVELEAVLRFVRDAFDAEPGSGDSPAGEPLAEGPYEGSAYYGASARYSALHTCNTWAAEALQSAGLPVRPRRVLFAGQLWRRAIKLGTPPREPTLELLPAQAY